MDKLKQWIALTVLGCIVISAAGWFLLVAPKRSDAAGLRNQADAQRATNSGLSQQIQMLKAQAKELPAKQAALAAVAAKIPDNPALPSLVRALTKAADDAGVELVSLSPSAPATVTAAVAKSSVVSPSAQKPVSTSNPAVATPAGSPGTPATAGTAGSLSSIDIAINVVGGYFQVEQFLDRVENLTRATKVTSFTLAPGNNPVKAQPVSAAGAITTVPVSDPGKVLSATVIGRVFMATGRLSTTTTVGK